MSIHIGLHNLLYEFKIIKWINWFIKLPTVITPEYKLQGPREQELPKEIVITCATFQFEHFRIHQNNKTKQTYASVITNKNTFSLFMLILRIHIQIVKRCARL